MGNLLMDAGPGAWVRQAARRRPTAAAGPQARAEIRALSESLQGWQVSD